MNQHAPTTRRAKILVAAAFLFGAVVGAALGILGFIRIVGGTGEASRLITAPTLKAASTLDPKTSSSIPSTTPQPTVATTVGEQLSGEAVFRIAPDESQARYLVREEKPDTTVIGVTNQVAGDVLVNFDSPRSSRIGTIRINVRTFQTDAPDRDDAVRAAILESARDQFEFAEFTPVVLDNIWGSTAVSAAALTSGSLETYPSME